MPWDALFYSLDPMSLPVDQGGVIPRYRAQGAAAIVAGYDRRER